MTAGWSSYFDAAAAEYDAATRGGWFPNQHAGEVLASLDLAPASVLDLGAGTGQTAAVAHRLWPGAALTLVDGSSGMADVARARLPHAHVVVADVDDFVDADNASYDLVTAVGVLEMLPDVRRFLAAVAARLSPGGHVLATHEPLLPGSGVQSSPMSVLGASGDRAIRRRSPLELEQAATEAGLQRVAAREFTAYERDDTEEAVVYELAAWVRPGAGDP